MGLGVCPDLLVLKNELMLKPARFLCNAALSVPSAGMCCPRYVALRCINIASFMQSCLSVLNVNGDQR